MWKFLSWIFRIVMAVGCLTFAAATIASYFGVGRSIAGGSGPFAAVFAALYVIGAAVWEATPWWTGKSSGSHSLPSSVAEAMPPPGPEYCEQPLPNRKPPEDLAPSHPAPRRPTPST
jgi:hypothetical protein